MLNGKAHLTFKPIAFKINQGCYWNRYPLRPQFRFRPLLPAHPQTNFKPSR